MGAIEGIFILIITVPFWVLSPVALYFIFKALLAPIPIKRRDENEEYFYISRKVWAGHCLLTSFLGVLIYLIFPGFWFVLINVIFNRQARSSYFYNGYVLLALPFILWGLIVLFKAVTRANCKKYPGMDFLINQRRPKTFKEIKMLIFLFPLFFLFLQFCIFPMVY